MPKLTLIFFVFIALSINCFAQEDQVNSDKLSKDAPADQSHSILKDEQKHYDKMIAPYVAQARKTLPDAKERFLSRLQPGESFFLVTRIYDQDGKFEQVFVRIKKWNGDNISGLIANNLNVVKEYQNGQLIAFKEKDVLDWLVAKRDGSEEGNFIGKYLDSLSR
ncbi:MAG: hypothetical protein K0R51_1115 [Cytophagaceae bacterium]|jgi:uncharacterized protein YegJ (DUF2314 family)|nr:hypothetical protein [Cytophagaceae bacterium]